MKIIAALFLAVLAAGPGRAELASFDGESVTYARDGTVYRGSLEPLMDGSPSWRPIYSAPGTVESVSCLPPSYRRCLVVSVEAGLRRLKEIDSGTGTEVSGGFTLESEDIRADWYDDKTIMLVSDAVPGSRGREGGAPKLVQLWERGTPVLEAQTILRTPPGSTDLKPIFDLSTGGIFYSATYRDSDGTAQIYHFGWQHNLVMPGGPPGFVFQDFFQARAIVRLEASWPVRSGTVPPGGLAAYPMGALMAPGRVTAGERAFEPPAGYGVEAARGGRDRLYIHLRGAGDDRLVDVRVGQPNWLERRIDIPGDGPITLLAVSELADIALVRRGGDVYAVGRGRPRTVALPD